LLAVSLKDGVGVLVIVTVSIPSEVAVIPVIPAALIAAAKPAEAPIASSAKLASPVAKVTVVPSMSRLVL